STSSVQWRAKCVAHTQAYSISVSAFTSSSEIRDSVDIMRAFATRLLLICFTFHHSGCAPPGPQREDEDVRMQIEKLWQEINALKETQALQTVCLRGIKVFKKCYLVSDQAKHFHEANEACIAQGGTLAIPRDSTENDQLRDYAKRSSAGAKDFWIGITDIVKEGQYVDVNSQPVSFFLWNKAKKEPTGGKRESCVALSLATQGKWHDEVCRALKKYICEYLIP
ncbi:hypothetical protein DNTS_021643, partial [Danionella cerebrum]